MGLMRFQGSGCRALPATPYPTPPFKNRGGAGWWQDMYVYTPPWGGGKKAKRPFTPRENLG